MQHQAEQYARTYFFNRGCSRCCKTGSNLKSWNQQYLLPRGFDKVSTPQRGSLPGLRSCFENLYIVNFFGFLDKESLLRGKATRAGRYLADIQVLRMYRNFFCIATKAVDGNIWLRWITLLDHRRQFPVQSNNKGSPVTAMPPRMVIQSSSCVVTFLHMLPFVSGRSSKPKQFRRNTPRKKVYRTIF